MSEHLQFHTQFRSPTVSLTDVRCRPDDCACGPEEYSTSTSIVFPRAGAFVRHVQRQQVLANCNHVHFFRAGESYRVSHPVPGGDDCSTLAFDPAILVDAVSSFDPGARERPDSPVRVTCGPSRAGLCCFLHRLRQTLGASDCDGLAVEEWAIALLEAVLGDAYRSSRNGSVRQGRSTARIQRERVESAKSHVTGRFRERLSLTDIAQAVHYSPYHLARLFRREVGEPIHRYLTRLRLGVALERLADGCDDLTALGLELGFSSHSHFTSAFCREFGVPPSQFRRAVSVARLRELSKNLKAGPPSTQVG